MTDRYIIFLRKNDRVLSMFSFLDGIKGTLVAIAIGLFSLAVGNQGIESFIYFIVTFGLYAFYFGVYKENKD